MGGQEVCGSNPHIAGAHTGDRVQPEVAGERGCRMYGGSVLCRWLQRWVVIGAELADTLFAQTADLTKGVRGLEIANGVSLSW